MSETRVSQTQPQGPAFAKAPEAPSKASEAPKAPISASKASKAAKAPKTGPEAKPLILKSGAKGQCQVTTGASQCSNPANYPWQGHTTCRTHLKRLEAGKAYRFTKVIKAYDKSLWGGPEAPAKA